MTQTLLKPEEAAKLLSVSVKQLRSLDIPYIDIGCGQRVSRRYEPSDIQHFMEARKCRSTGVKAQKPTTMTSVIVGIDFTAPRTKPKSGRRKGSSRI